MVIFPEQLKWEQNPKFTPLSETGIPTGGGEGVGWGRNSSTVDLLRLYALSSTKTAFSPLFMKITISGIAIGLKTPIFH